MEELFEGYSVEIDKISKEEWSDLLKIFMDSTVYQTWEYGQVRWGEANLSHIVIKKNEDIISVVQVRIIKIPLVKVGIAYVTWGPLWKRRGNVLDINRFRLMLKVLKKEYANSRKLLLRIRPHAFYELDRDMKQVLTEEGFQNTKGMFKDKKYTILVDLNPSVVDLRKNLHKKWRGSLNKSEKNNLSIVEGYDEQLFTKFKPIFDELINKKKFTPGVNVGEIEQIQKTLPQDKKMRITICEVHGKPVSGSVCSYIGDTVVGMLSATNDEGRSVNAYYLLQWDEILWSKKVGRNFYDLGGINQKYNPSVYRFKSRINGKEVTFMGVYDYCENKFINSSIATFENLLLHIKKFR